METSADVQALDHPLGTKLVSRGVGPSHPWLEQEYREVTGREVLDDFPDWEPAHKVLLSAGIPGIENIGGDVDEVTSKRCTFMCFPFRWPEGEGCGVRVVAVLDPNQEFRLETGK
jgi:kynurenine formamidase